MIKAMLMYQFLESKIINKRKDRTTDDEIMADCVTYAKATYNSKLYEATKPNKS